MSGYVEYGYVSFRYFQAPERLVAESVVTKVLKLGSPMTTHLDLSSQVTPRLELTSTVFEELA